MSYSITVRVHDGKVSGEASGDVPAGVFKISGHEQADYSYVSVQQVDADGEAVVTGSGTSFRKV